MEDEKAELKRVEHELYKAHNILDKKGAELFKWEMNLDYPPEPEDPEALCNYERVKDEMDLLIEGCRRLLQRMSDLTLGTKGKGHHLSKLKHDRADMTFGIQRLFALV
jgi:hypothetical protein